MTKTDGESLAEMGTDGAKWAAEFKRVVQGEPDEETMQAWFANAIATAITAAESPFRTALARACDIACYLECHCSTKERLSGHRTDCVWGEYKEEIKQLRVLADSSPSPISENFEQAWSRMEKVGFRYGHDALEQVRFGFELARFGAYAAHLPGEAAVQDATSEEELAKAANGIVNGPTLLRMVAEIRELRRLAIRLEVERDEALDLSSCKVCPSGFCSAHQPFTGKIAALNEALEDVEHVLTNIWRGNASGLDADLEASGKYGLNAGYVLKAKKAENCLARIKAILQRGEKDE